MTLQVIPIGWRQWAFVKQLYVPFVIAFGAGLNDKYDRQKDRHGVLHKDRVRKLHTKYIDDLNAGAVADREQYLSGDSLQQ